MDSTELLLIPLSCSMSWEKTHKEAWRILKRCDQPILLHKSFSDLKHLPLLTCKKGSIKTSVIQALNVTTTGNFKNLLVIYQAGELM